MLSDVMYKRRLYCELKGPDCEDCRSSWEKIVTTSDYETNVGEFDIYLCRKHKLGFTDPYPTEETCGFLYETRETGDFDIIRNTPIDHIKDFLASRQIANMVPKDSRIDAVLDYSTGNGRFAFLASRVFKKARIDAVDYQEQSPPLLEKNKKIVNYYSSKDFRKSSRKYDLIILRHVLEHSHHPVTLLVELASRLASKGILYIEVPNLESGCAKIFGRYWKGFYVPRHIFHYTIDSLSEIIHKGGLEADIERNEMPMMGNIISIFTGIDKSNLVIQFCGILLHPVQLAIEKAFQSSTCLNARCKHKGRVEQEDH